MMLKSLNSLNQSQTLLGALNLASISLEESSKIIMGNLGALHNQISEILFLICLRNFERMESVCGCGSTDGMRSETLYIKGSHCA